MATETSFNFSSMYRLTIELRDSRLGLYLWIVTRCICMANPRFIHSLDPLTMERYLKMDTIHT